MSDFHNFLLAAGGEKRYKVGEKPMNKFVF
jgi:hypothetical protein